MIRWWRVYGRYRALGHRVQDALYYTWHDFKVRHDRKE